MAWEWLPMPSTGAADIEMDGHGGEDDEAEKQLKGNKRVGYRLKASILTEDADMHYRGRLRQEGDGLHRATERTIPSGAGT